MVPLIEVPHKIEACEAEQRIAAACESQPDAEAIAREVLALYTCGPAGGGGVRTAVTPRLSSDSCFVPREWLQPSWRFVE